MQTRAKVPICDLNWTASRKVQIFAGREHLPLIGLASSTSLREADTPSPMDVMNSAEALTDNRKEYEYRLGVLLVHGIGTQPCGDTLVRWGDILLKTICNATRNRVQTHVGRAGRDGEGTHDAPMTAEVRLQSSSKTEKWLVADGWWADVFLPPNYQELVSWSVRALPWAIAIHIAQRFWNAPKHKNRAAKFVYNAFAILQLLAGLALAPICVLLLVLTLAVGLLPIPQLRSLILAAQGTLVSTVGDCLAFVESPVRAALIRTRILNRLNWLKQRCECTIIIAHSQGAAIVLDALGAIRDESLPEDSLALKRDAPSDEQQHEEKHQEQASMPDTLVTFGAGTNQLTSLKRLSGGVPLFSKLDGNPVIYAMSGLLGFGGILAWLIVAAFLHQTTVIKIFVALAGVVVSVVVFGLVMLALMKFIDWIGKCWPAVKKHEEWIPVLIITSLICVIVPLVRRSDIPMGPVSLIFFTVVALILGIKTILSQELRSAITMVTVPPQLTRWYDLYASADPVPNGPTRLHTESETCEFKSDRIFNLGSFFADHTAYWDNLDGFVLRAAKACAETAESFWKEELPPESSKANERAEWRVGCLRLARYAIYLSWLVAAVHLWPLHGTAIPLPFELPAWLAPLAIPTLRLVIFAGAIAAAAWLSVRVVQLFWQRWVRSEQQLLFARQAIGDREFLWLFGFGYLIWFFILLAYFAGAGSLPQPATPNDLGDVALIIFFPPLGGSFLSWLILAWWWRPGPEVPAPK
jgi:hypothetical protein